MPFAFMGCGVSKIDLKEAGQIYPIRSLRRRSSLNDSDSSSSKNRKSVSSVNSEGGGFMKRVIGSNEKDRGVERDLEAGNDLAISRSKQPQGETMELKESPKEKTKSQNKDHGHDHDPNDDDDDHHPEDMRPSNADERSASILYSPGSPSFRVYCVTDMMIASYEDNDDDEEREESKSNKENNKGPEIPPAKRGRKGRGFRSAMNMGGPARGLRGVLQRGGSAGKNILSANSCRIQTSSPSHNESTAKLIAKAG